MPSRKTASKKSTTKPSRKSPAKKSPKPAAPKPKARATTPKSKSKPRAVSEMFKKSNKSTAASGECNPGYGRDALTRKCESIPCFDPRTGETILGATRSPNGACRLPRCKDGHILNPMTGKCISTDTPTGQSLLPYKYEADARAARAKADRYSGLSPYANEGYPGMFRAFSEHRRQQRGAHEKAQDAASTMTRVRRERDLREFERRVAFLRANLGLP